ncbi:hypothetical protein [Capillimicrobium parvum]|uniref:Asl1-like glycosyl hydrolase catalytic domain-containing protein n=1 Tax=Capillimicrobium parvum TaxID=2884022 RepID=A0A9E7C1M0_9ACTN|nr:hypothetical protein [Capillimicrobium parvum]UGS36568.1 hypothetical protein DSM104329_02975 [Capillimicrobium parvum]
MTRHRLRTIAAVTAIAATGTAAAAGTASARPAVPVGISDQSAAMFDSPLFQQTAIKQVRYFVAWNAARHRGELNAVRDYVRSARSHGISVLVHIGTDDFRPRRAHLPTVREYRRDVGRLVRTLRPLGVRDWGAFNEANHPSEPTYRSPKRAARLFVALRSMCGGCRVVALDVLDTRGVTGYIDRFYGAMTPTQRRQASLVGIHNYSDVNRRTTAGTSTIMRAVRTHVRSPHFWLTETGGIVELGSAFRCNERRAANRTTYLFKLLHTYRHAIDRAYIYNWKGTDCRTRMDTGMVNADGTPRPAYTALRRGLRR